MNILGSNVPRQCQHQRLLNELGSLDIANGSVCNFFGISRLRCFSRGENSVVVLLGWGVTQHNTENNTAKVRWESSRLTTKPSLESLLSFIFHPNLKSVAIGSN